MQTYNQSPDNWDDQGLAQLDAELAKLKSNMGELQAALAELLDAMQLQAALELGAPQAGDQLVRWN